jgi:hypothetical protein
MNTRKAPAMATTPESFVDALNSAFGKQTTQRAAHAKGVVLLGKFVPSAEAASVSKALHFKHEVPVTVRFSANTGMSKIAEADPRASPRGLAIRFRLPDGSDTDLVTHSYNGFPAKNPEEFQQFFLAVAVSKPGVPSPTPIEAFQETHPAAKTFDHAGSAAGQLRDDHLLRREQLQVRQRKGRRDDWALSAASRRRPTVLVEGRERQGGDQLSRRRDSPARCPWSGPVQGGAAARSAGRQDRRSIGGLGEHQ